MNNQQGFEIASVAAGIYRRRAVLAVAAALLLMTLAAQAAPAVKAAGRAPVVLSMATEYPATSMPGQGVTTFAELVEKKTRGAVTIKPSFDAAAGFKSGDMVDAVAARKVDAGDAFAGGMANKYPIFAVSSLPFLADSLKKAVGLNKAAMPTYQKFFAEHGQKLLYTTPWPASGIWSKAPVRSLADLQALNIRTYDNTSQAVMTRAGATAVNISFADAMPRIAAGDVNAVLSSGDGGAGRKLWEYLPRFTEINYAMPVSVATMNLDAYKALDPAARAAIDAAAAETEKAQWKRIETRLKENYDTMRKNGVTIDTTVPAEVKQALTRASSGSVAEWKKANAPASTVILNRFGAK